METVKEFVIDAVQWLKLGVEVTGAIVLAVGVIIAFYHFAHTFALGQLESYVEVRQTLVRYLALAPRRSPELEPDWQIGCPSLPFVPASTIF